MQPNPAKIDWSQLKSGKGIATMIITAAFVLWLGGAFHSSNKPADTTTVTAAEAKADTAAAEQELSDVMALAQKAKLVTSYKLSKTEATVYAGLAWYMQPVDLKKDFLAKVATLKKTITGYGHFEVRDAISNKKVGEVTALGSLEIYQ